jgi:hypothetical protein
MLTTSCVLPVICQVRQGVRVILASLEASGFTTFSGIAFFGASRSEPRVSRAWHELARSCGLQRKAKQ